MLAWHAANVLQPHSKQHLSPQDLLPKDFGSKKKPRGPKDMNTRDLKNEFEEITQEFEDD